MIIFLDGEEASCTTIWTQRVCDSFSHHSGAISSTAGKHSQLSNTLGEEDSSSVWGVQVTALTCLLLQVVSFNFFVALKLLNYSTGQLSPRGES